MLETNAAAHKKQRKSIFPDDKSQILNNNANAHKKKQESISPEEKDLSDYLKRIILLHNTNIASLSLLIRKLKLSQLMQQRTKNNMSCFPRQNKQDSWKSKLNNVINI